MRIASRFSIAVHVLALLGSDLTPEPTSEFIAGSVGVNPVVVRNITGMLKRAGLVVAQQGKAGTFLARPLERITLLDIYRAVGADDDLFGCHPHPHPDCPVGAHIQETLDDVFHEAQQAMEARLAANTMAQIVDRILAAEPDASGRKAMQEGDKP